MRYRVTGNYYTNELYHHGIKGQKWGIQNGPPYPLDDPNLPGKKLYKIDGYSKNGVKVSMVQKPTSKMTAFIAKVFPSRKEQIMNDSFFDIVVDDQRVGQMFLFKESNDSLNVNWISIDNTNRGKGYAQASMKAVVDFAKKQGFKQMTLEVPGDSPDAKHIYEKLGFRDDGSSYDEDNVWGGLTNMKLVFDKH